MLALLRQKRHRIPQIYSILLWVAIISPEIPKRDLRIQGCWGASAYVGFWGNAEVGGWWASVGKEIEYHSSEDISGLAVLMGSLRELVLEAD